MKTKFPKSFVLLIAAMVIIVALFVTASAKNNELSSQSVSDVSSEYDVSSDDELPMSGYCGENIKWELDENGVLRLEGSGDMYDFIGEGYTGQCGDYCYGYYPADPSSSTTRNETTTVPYSYYPTTRPYTENTTYYPATTAPYSQEYTTNPYSYETTYHYGTTTAPQHSTTTYYQEPTTGYPESTTVYYGTTTAQYETTTFSQPSSNTTYSQGSTSRIPVTTKRYATTTSLHYPDLEPTTSPYYPDLEPTTSPYYPDLEPTTSPHYPDLEPTTSPYYPDLEPTTSPYYPDLEPTTSPYYPDLEPTTSYNGGYWTYGKIYRWNLHFDEIKEVIIGEGITSVGNSAFANCTNLKSVTLPSTLASIDTYAFKMCISLEEISVPDSVEAIGYEVFYGCLNLKKITLGNGIKSIAYGAFKETGYYINEENWVDSVLYIDNCLIEAKDDISGEYSVKDGTIVLADYAFNWCDNLLSVTIPDDVTIIPYRAFSSCSSLKSVLISGKITNIGDHAFNDCPSLANITMPDSLASIGDYAFSYCHSLTNITMPDNLTSIGYAAFEDCNNLEFDSLPVGLISIDSYAFISCTSLKKVHIPESVICIGTNAFVCCNNIKAITVDENNQYYSSDEYGALFDKEKTKLIQYPIGNERAEYIVPDGVMSIEANAFNSSDLSSITLPDGMTNIDTAAFENCQKLSSLTIPDSVENIGYGAFENCINLVIDNLPTNLKTIGPYAFLCCEKLSCGTIPDGVTEIESGAFEYCDSLKTVSIPSSVTYIGESAFSNCDSLEKIEVDENNPNYFSDDFGVLFNKGKTELMQYPIGNARTGYVIPDRVEEICYSSFENCDNLLSVSIPDSVTIIVDSSFCFCRNLTSVSFPESVTRIGSYAFAYCDGLTNISLPCSATNISGFAFYHCNNLKSISVDENNQSYSSDESGVLFNKDKTKLIQYPIGNKRTEYVIPDSVESIDSHAFSYCSSLSNVTIPKSICTVNRGAFSDCHNLNTVYYSGSPSMWNSIYFGYENDNLINATIIFAEENPPEPATIIDESTNVSVDYDAGKIEGEVGLSVEQAFDGKAFDIISTELEINDNVIYDIKMTIDGVETQPSGTVKVRIPIPDGYDPSKTFVYHVNTQIGTVERMNAVYEDGYLVFETDHFSYYAVVEIKDDEPVEQRFKVTWNSNGVVAENEYKEGDRITVPQNPTKEGYVFVGWTPAVPEFMPAYDLTFTAVFEAVVPPTDPHFEISIVKPSTSSVDYGDSIILHAQIDGALPEGAYIVWSESNGNFDMSVSDDGLTCKVSPKANGQTSFTVIVYDKDGNVISSGTQVMNANAGLWQRIVAFFKKIFGLTKTIPQVFKGIF